MSTRRRTLFPFLWVPTVLFLGHQWTLSQHLLIPFADDYLDPVLAVPLMVGWPVALLHRFWKSPIQWKSWPVFLFSAVLTILFEWWIPMTDSRFTSDPWDGIGYFTGACWVHFWLRKRVPLS